MTEPDRTGRAATSKDVALAAGVSRTSVSFAFNSPDKISAKTRTRILDTAADLGYRPHPIASMLVRGRTRSIGLLVPQDIPEVMQNPYYAQFLVGLGQVCHHEGMTLLIVPPLRNSLIEAIPYAAVDGFVVCGLETDRGEVAELERRHMPYVMVDGHSDSAHSIQVDDDTGAAAMMGHLLDLGHRRIAVLAFDAGPERDQLGYRGPLAARLRGIDEELARRGLTVDGVNIRIVEAECTRQAGFTATQQLLQHHDRPTAVFALSDILAAGALDAAHQLGLHVPTDVSIAGYDDQPEADWLRPKLTTVRQPIEAKGRVAGDLLITTIRDHNTQPRQHTLRTALILRQSTGRVPDPQWAPGP